MNSPPQSAPVLIQPVESPVICRPYHEPSHYWDYDRQTGRANKRDGRRPAAYWYKFAEADTRRGQLSLELEEDRRDLTLVNKLRADVKRWRNSGWEGATNVTKDLLRHWSRKDRPRRFFFCQLEAAETMIFLNEIRGYRRDRQRGKPRWNPEFTDGDFKLIWKMADGSVESLTRYACKMATGSGKTVVMAMIITWAFCNRARVPSDDRFPNAVLVCCPNLTIKERLQVLRTDNRGDDYYTQFDLIPPPYRDLLRTGKVLVTNWHFFAPESEHSEGGRSYAVVKKGEETDEAFARNRLGELCERGPIMVLNNEGHHAYRPAPIAEKETNTEAKKEREAATIWVQELDRIAGACGIRFCMDLSATPFYIKGSGYPEGEPFPWIVSDFGLVDTIESGITKIPRLPVSDTTGQPDPKYFRLWRNITQDLAAGQRLSNKRPKPEVVWERSQDAFVQLAGEYKKAFGSQFLCEQVVGRGLRRMNYTPDPQTELLPEEYVDVYGIPFSVIPYKGKPSQAPPGRPVNHVYAMQERTAYELRFPNVEGYVYALRKPSVRADFSTLERLVIEPERTPTATFLRIITDHLEGGARGGGIGEYVEHNRAAKKTNKIALNTRPPGAGLRR